MANIVAGEQYRKFDGQLSEIKRQLRQSGGYPFGPEELRVALQDIIEGRFGQYWETIELGTHESGALLLAALERDGYKANKGAEGIMLKPEFTVSPTRTKLRLYKVTADELGLAQGGTRVQIYDAAFVKGFCKIPAEAGPQTRLKYLNQQRGECLVIATDSISDSGGNLRLFVIDHDDHGRYLNAHCYYPDHVFLPDIPWLFGRR